jgi:DNA-binding NtrC family response regulator
LDVFKTDTPDVVITDNNMPEMSGEHIVDKIRAIKPGIKFIIITGKSAKPEMLDSINKRLECDHFIEKPVIFQKLFSAIELCLGKIAQVS